MMALRALTAGLPGVALCGDGEVVVRALTHDSRQVTAGALYVALPGRQVDGRRFIEAAVARGAVAVAVPADGEPLPAVEVPVVTLSAPRPQLAALASRLHGDPSARLALVGITGTNGKTTVATLLADMIAAAGQAEGLIGTNGLRVAGAPRPAQFTTPEAPQLQGLLAEMVTAGVSAVAMEVSSVGLAEHRVDATRFAAVGFTNLSGDHLDYHGDMAAYGAAKARLFRMAPDAVAVINVEDAFGADLAAQTPGAWRLALDGRDADVTVEGLVVDGTGCAGRLRTPRGAVTFHCPLLGRFNAMNAAVAGALAFAIGLPGEAIAAALGRAAIPGRMQTVGAGPRVVVDYAHSPDALERVIETLRPLTEGALWIVFGCGGDRDAVKRAPMGAAAAAADAVVITSDNPRSESPAVIAAAAAAGAHGAGRPARATPGVGGTWVQLDRRAAIAAAVAAAAAEDTVLIAGKGHEAYQEVAGVRRPFSDVIEAQRALQARAGGPRFHTDGLCAAAAGALIAGEPCAFDGVAIDTRRLAEGDAFFALRGPRFDAHDFLGQAEAAGARVLVVEAGHPALSAWAATRAAVVAVADPVAALQAFAAAHRAAFPGHVVALTGSSGKTTTKELVAAVLSVAGPTHRTPGNYNNHLGLPLTLLGLRPEHRFAVLELGMNHAGEIAALAALAQPHIGVVTTVGEAHIEQLGSVEAIAGAKGELFDALPADALAIYPSAVRERARLTAGLVAPALTVGADAGDAVRYDGIAASADGVTATLHVDGHGWPLALGLSGAHNVSNAALAVAVGRALGVSPADAVAALATLSPPPLRGEVRRLPDGGPAVLDCYNANPQSMRAAIEAFLGRGANGWAVLGDMLELGPAGPALHAAVGAWIAGSAPQLHLVGVGPLSAHLVAAAVAAGLPEVRCWAVDDTEGAAQVLRAHRAAGTPLLLKGSRGMALERVWTALVGEGT